MPLSSIKGYLDHAVETENEQIAFEMWKSIYPDMVLEKLNFVGFKEFKETIFKKKKQVPDKTAKEIESEMNNVIAAYEGR
jgi:hypothetical protein